MDQKKSPDVSTKNIEHCNSQDREEQLFENPNEFNVRFIKGKVLKPYQIEAIKWMIQREKKEHFGIRGGINSSSMGLGKSIEALTLILSEYTNSNINSSEICFPTLIICPVSAIYTWKEQIRNFFGNSCEFLIYKRDLLTKKQYDEIDFQTLIKYKIIITNYETVRTIAVRNNLHLKCLLFNSKNNIIGMKPLDTQNKLDNTIIGEKLLFNIKFNRIICDESHFYNNPKSLIFYSLMCLHADKKWGLTGTPIRNFSHDIYTQLMFLGFNKVYNIRDFTLDVYKQCNLSETILYMTQEDAGLKLPEITNINVNLKIDNNERDFYNYLYKTIKNAHNDFIQKKAGSYTNILAMFMRLRQFCSAPYTILQQSSQQSSEQSSEQFNENELFKGINDWLRDKNGSSGIKFIKISAAMNILFKRIPVDDKVIIYTNFKRTINLFMHALDRYNQFNNKNINFLYIDGDVTGEERLKKVEQFKSDIHCKILFLTYKVGSESLNLIEANHIILLEPVWCPAVISQAKCRVHRLGQTKKTTIWNMSIENTIEEKMLELCNKKQTMIKDFVADKSEDISNDIINFMLN